MVKHYILREELYPEESKKEVGFSNQVCILISHTFNKVVTYYEVSRNNGMLVQGEELYRNVPLKVTERLNFYVNSEKLALSLATKWCKENSNEENLYAVIDVDNTFSVFD